MEINNELLYLDYGGLQRYHELILNQLEGKVDNDDSRLSDSRTPTSHTHGNIQNGGNLLTEDITIASGDKIVVTDSSDSGKVARTSISFDGSTVNKALTPKGTWETFATSDTTYTFELNNNSLLIDGNTVFTPTVTSVAGKTGVISLDKSDVGLSNVTDDAQVKRTEMGVANGVATLDSNGLIPSSLLPSYVDDIVELIAISETNPSTSLIGDLYYNSVSKKLVKSTAANTWGTNLINPESGKIYVDLSINKSYRWGGSDMVEISSSLAIGTTSGTAADGGTVNSHINDTNNPHSVTAAQVGLGNVGNFKAVSTVASQGLSDTEKANARANIGAGTSSFSGSYNDLIDKPTIPTVPTNVSSFTNDAGYLTSHQDITGKANTSDLATVATSGDYDDLLNKPTIPTVPTNVSDFTNDAGYLTSHQDISGKQDTIDSLHKLSADLIEDGQTNKVINVKPDWNASSGTAAEILNKPTIPTVPTISTDISADASSDVKTASPKAVKTYVDTNAPTVMGASGTNHKGGLVPDPGTTQGSSKFLREDGTWQQPSANVPNNVALLENTDSTAYSPDFDAEVDTVHVTAQSLTTAQKTQARTNIGAADASTAVNSTVIRNIVTISQVDYTALSSKDNNTLYIIV